MTGGKDKFRIPVSYLCEREWVTWKKKGWWWKGRNWSPKCTMEPGAGSWVTGGKDIEVLGVWGNVGATNSNSGLEEGHMVWAGCPASLRNAEFRGSSIPRAERRKSGFVEEMQVSRAHTQSLQEAIWEQKRGSPLLSLTWPTSWGKFNQMHPGSPFSPKCRKIVMEPPIL